MVAAQALCKIFFRSNRILTVELHRRFLYIFFSGENAKIMNFMSGFFF